MGINKTWRKGVNHLKMKMNNPFPKGGPKSGNPAMTTSTVRARRKGDPQHMLRETKLFYYVRHGSFRVVCNPRNYFSKFLETWLPHAFSIMNREYIAYFKLLYAYIYIRSIIWIIWSISIFYSKSYLGILSE